MTTPSDVLPEDYTYYFMLPNMPFNYSYSDNYRVVTSCPMYISLSYDTAIFSYFTTIQGGSGNSFTVRQQWQTFDLPISEITANISSYYVASNNVHLYTPRIQVTASTRNTLLLSEVNSFRFKYDESINGYLYTLYANGQECFVLYFHSLVTEIDYFTDFDIVSDITPISNNSDYSDGFILGELSGYEKGYNVGLSENELSDSFNPLRVVAVGIQRLTDLQLFGNFSLGDLLSIAFGCILMGYAIKVFLGG